jgi:hypothetical protein
MRRIVIGILIILAGWWLWNYFFHGEPSVLPQNLAATKLSEAEIVYYRQVFDYTMSVTKPGEHYDWQSYSGKGSISPDKPFVSKSGATCRNFLEHYTIGTSNASAEGVACKREGKDGWCRLKQTDALTCVMETPENVMEKATQNTKDALEAGKDVLGKAKGIFR